MIMRLLGALCVLFYMLSLTATTSAAPRPIDSMNITGGSVIWSLPGGIPQHIIFSDFGANTNLVGEYIGVGGSTRDPFEPPDPDNILFFPVDELNNAVTYTAESNLGISINPPGVILGKPVPTGTPDESLNTIEMDLSGWFGNLNTSTYIWAGAGDLNDGFTSPIATGTLTGETFDEVSFAGTDSIKTVGWKPKNCHKKKYYKKHHDDDRDNDKRHHGKNNNKKHHNNKHHKD
jgi:hypothetical protein